MRFCDECGRIMRRETSTGRVQFVCQCGYARPGEGKDLRIAGSEFDAGSHLGTYMTLLRFAAQDPTNHKVARVCPRCKLDYMTLVRLTDAELINYVCKCGYGVPGAAAPER